MQEPKEAIQHPLESYERRFWRERPPSQSNALPGKSHPTHPKRLWRRRWHFFLGGLRYRVYTLWLEVRSLCHRMQSESNTLGCVPIKKVGCIPPLRTLPADIARLSSSDCIARLRERLPWVSLSDVSLYQEGWEAGVLFCVRNPGVCMPRNSTEKLTTGS